MANNFGKRRDSSFGIWKKDHDDTDVDEKDPLIWGANSPTRDKLSENPEDDLIAKMDRERAGISDEEEARGFDHTSEHAKMLRGIADISGEEGEEDDQVKRGDVYFKGKAAANVGKIHQSGRADLSPAERLQHDIGKDERLNREYRKRHLSNAQIGREAQMRKHRKSKHK